MSHVRSEAGAVWRITLERLEARNAVTREMLDDLLRSLGAAGLDPDARVVVLAGEGPDFCAGADLDELEAWLQDDGLRDSEGYGDPLNAALRAIADCPVPVVVGVQGAALGAGCLLVSACDLAVAAEEARLGIPSARLGAALGPEIVARLVRAVGPGRAAALLCAGRTLTGEEAASWGLVSEAVPATQLEARVEGLAADLAAGAPLSVRAAKAAIRLGEAPDDDDVQRAEAMATAAMASDDIREGIRAFREGRPPEFRGR